SAPALRPAGRKSRRWWRSSAARTRATSPAGSTRWTAARWPEPLRSGRLGGPAQRVWGRRRPGAEEPAARLLSGRHRPGVRHGGVELLERRHHFLGEEAQVALGLVVRHARVAEDTHVVAVAGARVDVEDLLVALLGPAPHLEVHEVVDHGVGAVLLDLLRHLAVVLVASGVGQMVALELVVVEHGLVVAAYVAPRHLLGTVGARVAEGPARRDRGRRVHPVDPAVDVAIRVPLARPFLSRLRGGDADAGD